MGIRSGQEAQAETRKGNTMNINPTTIDQLADVYGMQQYEVAAALDLGADYDPRAELDEATIAEYREILDIMAEQAQDNA
jgi:hypothetical protein